MHGWQRCCSICMFCTCDMPPCELVVIFSLMCWKCAALQTCHQHQNAVQVMHRMHLHACGMKPFRSQAQSQSMSMLMQASSRALVRCNKIMIHVTTSSKSVLRYPKARDLFLGRCHHNGYKLQACRDNTLTEISTTNNKQDKRGYIVFTVSNNCASCSQQWGHRWAALAQ